MQELSLNILDIVQNSIKANATQIDIVILENTFENIMEIVIEDNGCGMNDELLKNVTNPFTTTRTSRKVGLGLPLFKQAAEEAGGVLIIDSEVGVGTIVKASFQHDNIDRKPLGDIAETIFSIVSMNTEIELFYKHIVDHSSFEFDTVAIKNILGDVDMGNIDVLMWIKDYLNEGISNLYK